MITVSAALGGGSHENGCLGGLAEDGCHLLDLAVLLLQVGATHRTQEQQQADPPVAEKFPGTVLPIVDVQRVNLMAEVADNGT